MITFEINERKCNKIQWKILDFALEVSPEQANIGKKKKKTSYDLELKKNL